MMRGEQCSELVHEEEMKAQVRCVTGGVKWHWLQATVRGKLSLCAGVRASSDSRHSQVCSSRLCTMHTALQNAQPFGMAPLQAVGCSARLPHAN